jgi:2-oxoisovalerate dehydrogenase E2 component (dihydrolipoyl transacylase)
MPDFLLPDLGEGLAEAEVVSWRVRVGDRVGVDQVIAEVETAKAVVEVPVPYAGVVAALHAEQGGTVCVGQPLITVTADEPAAGFREPGIVIPEQASVPVNGSARGTADNMTVADPAVGGTAAGDALADSEEPSGSVLIGYGTTAAPTRTRRGRRHAAAGAPPASASPVSVPPASVPPASAAGASAPAARPATPPSATPSPAELSHAGPSPVVAAPVTAGRPARVAVISPLVRKEARDAGLDLADLAGTGPAGVVSREDVRQALAERDARRQRSAPAVQPFGPEAGGGERRIPLRGARRAAADKLSRSRREIPEATVWVDVDATGLVEARRALNAADPARPVSLLALLARFTVLGLRRYPELNARIEQDEIIVPEGVNLGFAAQTDHGLVVPVVHDAHRLTTRELSASLAERATAARERRLAPADLAGGTFTVNNYGVFGVDGSAAIINHPEVAILGLGRVIDRPWVVDGQLTVRKVTELTLAFDHRACDGGTAGGFLRYVADRIESPATALGDM